MISILCIVGCESEYTPKPKGYYRITFPEKKYQVYSSACNFNFEYPTYARIVKDTFPRAEDCWMNLEFPDFNGTLHLSYKKVNNNLRQLTEDSRTLAMKHAVRAQEIDEIPFVSTHRVYGLRYDIKGNVASSLQFYLTDSLHHFVRVSLYFKSAPNADSLAPVLRFLQQDVDRMIQSFRWVE